MRVGADRCSNNLGHEASITESRPRLPRSDIGGIVLAEPLPRAGILRDEMAHPGSRDGPLLAERVEGFVSQVYAACVGHRQQSAGALTTLA